jgi:hypothetical protein
LFIFFERNHLATRDGAECGKLDGASVIGTYNAKADHGQKSCKKYRFSRARSMDLSQIGKLRKAVFMSGREATLIAGWSALIRQEKIL